MENQKLLHENNQLRVFLLYSFSDPRKSEFLGEFPALWVPPRRCRPRSLSLEFCLPRSGLGPSCPTDPNSCPIPEGQIHHQIPPWGRFQRRDPAWISPEPLLGGWDGILWIQSRDFRDFCPFRASSPRISPPPPSAKPNGKIQNPLQTPSGSELSPGDVGLDPHGIRNKSTQEPLQIHTGSKINPHRIHFESTLDPL